MLTKTLLILLGLIALAVPIGAALGWLGPVFQGHEMMAKMYYGIIGAAVLAYLASLVFFFLVRKRTIQ